MEISSSSVSQCRPTRLNSTCSRWAAVARNNRGNHARGTPSVRPSLSPTHMACSSKRTLVAETIMRWIVAWMSAAQSGIAASTNRSPDFAVLHPGYAALVTETACGSSLARRARPGFRFAKPHALPKDMGCDQESNALPLGAVLEFDWPAP
jgi:hypothetical protein